MTTTTARVRTACPYCGVGCGLVLEVGPGPARNGGPGGAPTVLKASGDKAHPANRGRLCTKGATAADLLTAPAGRLTHALVRPARAAAPEPAPTAAAVTEAGRRLRAIADEHGPDSVALYVSGQMSLEAQYLATKLAKGFLRTSAVEANSRLCMASAATGYKLSLGADGPPGSYDDLDRADLFLVVGANMADCHPVLFLRMMDRVKAGAKLIVVDPRRTATAEKADLFLPIRPGTDLALLNGLLHLLHADGRLDEDFIARHTEGWAAMPSFLADYPPDAVAAATGLPEAGIREAARLIGEAAAGGEWTSCWTMGLNQSIHGTWNTNALINLHLATGAICRPGSGPFSLTGQPNAMGGRDMGYMGPGLPGQRSLTAAADREFTERLWGLPPGTIRAEDPGRGTVEMFRRMAAGEIKACWIICTNPVASVANRRTVVAGLEAAELVVVQDVFARTETTAYADIVLPAAMWAEAEGVMVSSERTLTLAAKAVDPPGEALPDWRIIADVAAAMGYGDAFDYAGPEDVFAELRRAANPLTGYDLRGASYDRLRETPLQWPLASADGPARNPIRYLRAARAAPDGPSSGTDGRSSGNGGTDGRSSGDRGTDGPGSGNGGTEEGGGAGGPRFPTPSGRAVFHARPYLPPAELPDRDFPFVLNTGRVQHQWHTLTKTGKVAALNRLNPGPFVEVHPDDARRLGLADGDPVELTSRRGRAVLPALVTDRVQQGSCFAPFHWNDLFGAYRSVNAVTSDAVDPLSYQPEFKVCAVALAKAVTVREPAAAHPASAGPPAGAAGAADPGRVADAEAEAAGARGTAGPGKALPGPGPVAPAAQAAAPAASATAAPAAATALLGPGPVLPPPVLSARERRYLAGFLAGLRPGPAPGPEPGHQPGQGGVPVLPAGAPFDPGHALWVNGLLAGLYSRTGSRTGSGTGTAAGPPPGAAPADAARAATAGPPREIVVLWASQTGTAAEFAAMAAQKLVAGGHRARLVGMAETTAAQLPPGADLLVVTSTFGDGDPPDNGAAFWRTLAADDAPRLAGVRFSVLAFGDSSYADFCGHGRRMDARLADLGGVRLVPRSDCEPDDADAAARWLDQVLTALAAPPGATTGATPGREPVAVPVPGLMPGPVLEPGPESVPVPGPELVPVPLPLPVSGPSPAPGPALPAAPATETTAPTEATAIRDRVSRNPPARTAVPGGPSLRDPVLRGTARLVGNRLLSGPGAAKEVRQFTLDTRDSPVPLTYEAGDALAVHPANSPALVAEWLAVTGADPAAPVTVEGVGQVAFHEALRRHLDITRITPGLLRFVADRDRTRGGDRFLRKLLRPDNTDELARWSWGRQAVDLVAAHPVAAGAGQWAGVLRRLRPRLYSISTSPLTDPYLIGLTVGVVRYEGPGGRPRAGVCSAFLADSGPGAEIPVRVRRSPRFRPPTGPAVPMVMIGPGTGVAPFLGFLAERRALGHTGPNWLFFGEQHRASDFYAERELAALRADGTLTRLDTAFSRDQRAKVYVQDRMRERGPQLWSWLQEGAHVYVCGDAARMAKDVDRALRDIAARHGGLSPEAAAAYVEQLAAAGRYARDVY